MTDSNIKQLFISYSREDIESARALRSHLNPLIFSSRLKVFFDTESIEKGEQWEKKISSQLQQADAFIFLISRYYFDSQYVVTKELPSMIRRYRDEQVKFWPFYVSEYAWDDFEFEGIRLSDIQAIGPYDAQDRLIPLNELNTPDKEAQFKRVYGEVKDWIDQLEKEQQAKLEATRRAEEEKAIAEEEKAKQERERIAKELEEHQRQVELKNRRKAEEEEEAAKAKQQAARKAEEKKRRAELYAKQQAAREAEEKKRRVELYAKRKEKDKAFKEKEKALNEALSKRSSGLEATKVAGQGESESSKPPVSSFFAIRVVPIIAIFVIILAIIIYLERKEDEVIGQRTLQELNQELKKRETETKARQEEAIRLQQIKEDKQRQREKDISQLLASAQQDIKADRLTYPDGNNALERLHKVRLLDPGNPRVTTMLEEIINRYIELAKSAVNRKAFKKAKQYLDRAKLVNANSPKLFLARTALEKSISKNSPGVFQDNLSGGGKGPSMVLIPAGSFLMGSAESEAERDNEEGPQHTVHIKSFALGKFEVTVDEFSEFVNETDYVTDAESGIGCYGWITDGKDDYLKNRPWRSPGFSQTSSNPVTCISWKDAQQYVTWLSKKAGKVYRLPTEAEWEYAARAGTKTAFSTGDCINTNQANYNGTEDYADCGAKTGVYRYKTLPVNELAANPWGLQHMHGNVSEWTQDCAYGNYQGAPKDGIAWESSDCTTRVHRGGGWTNVPKYLRSASRSWNATDFAHITIGFRLARDL